MLAIAFKNGISLAELQEANPDVNPRLMSVGTELIIPLGESIPSVPMTPTPLPLNTKPPVCYLTPDGIWCFLLVNNDRARPLENISAQMILFDSGGEAVTNGDAIAPINHLLPSKSIPLVLFMAGEYLPGTSAVANIITAQFIPKEDDRYLNAWIETDQTEISNSGKSVQVEGMYGVPLKSAASGSVWIVAVAYDQNGDVVGFKKLEIYEELEPGGSRDFSLEISSLGLPIERVELLIEARPVPELDQDEESS